MVQECCRSLSTSAPAPSVAPAYSCGLETSDNKFYLLRARALRWLACSAAPRQRCPAPAGQWACIGGLGQALRAHFGLRRRRHKPKRQGKTRVVCHILKNSFHHIQTECEWPTYENNILICACHFVFTSERRLCKFDAINSPD